MSDECMADRDLIFGEISQERSRQDEEWGGPIHDDSHEPFEWCDYIDKQNRAAASIASYKRETFESRMVKIAALALAAIESSRRQSK